MMKDMKWKQIDTTYAGKAYQVEAEDIRLHGDVNITGSLTVNDSPLDAPTASGTSYDNTVSGLTGTNVQDAVDELADVRVKTRNFNNLAEFATWAIANYATNKILIALDDANHAWTCISNNTNLYLFTTYLGGSSFISASITNDGTSTSGYYMIGNNTPSSAGTIFDSRTFQVYYV